jgi:hypothetical protein
MLNLLFNWQQQTESKSCSAMDDGAVAAYIKQQFFRNARKTTHQLPVGMEI